MKYIISNKVNGTSEVRLLIRRGMDGKLGIIKGTNDEQGLGKKEKKGSCERLKISRRRSPGVRLRPLSLCHSDR